MGKHVSLAGVGEAARFAAGSVLLRMLMPFLMLAWLVRTIVWTGYCLLLAIVAGLSRLFGYEMEMPSKVVSR